MSADCRQLEKFAEDIEKLSDTQREEFLVACCKELAARLLQKVINNTKTDTGTLRRGWTVNTHEEAASGTQVGVNQWCNSVRVKKQGNTYSLEVTNPVYYAPYYEYGHRTINGAGVGWVEGKFVLTIAESELNAVSDAILARKLQRYMREVFNQ